MRELRCVIIVAAAILLALTALFPWVEVWRHADIPAYLAENPINKYGLWVPEVKMMAWWDQAAYDVVAVRSDIILIQVLAVLGWAGFYWQLTRRDELRVRLEKFEPPYCAPRETQELDVSPSSSGTVGPLG